MLLLARPMLTLHSGLTAMSGLFLSLEDPAILVVEGVAEVLPLSRVLRTQLQAGL